MKTKLTKKEKIEQIKQFRDEQIKEILEINSPFPIDKAGLITEARRLCNMSVYEVINNLW